MSPLRERDEQRSLLDTNEQRRRPSNSEIELFEQALNNGMAVPEIGMNIYDVVERAANSKGELQLDVDYDGVLSTLEQFECWHYWFECVKRHARLRPDLFKDDYCRMAKVKISYFDDVKGAADFCAAIVESSGMSYQDFCSSVLANILDQDAFRDEGLVLQKVWERFSTFGDRIAALERMCFIYEKKYHNEAHLSYFYEKLLKLHPENPKALRYFRSLYTQLNHWSSVVDVLLRLLKSAKHPQEIFRHAQELAAVYLYQLDDPVNAVRYIEQYCTNSTLDTSTIHFEAYSRMENFEGCLKVLNSCLNSLQDDETRSIVFYRMAELYEQNAMYEQAIQHYQAAYNLNPRLIEVIEGLISVYLQLNNWQEVRRWLENLASSVVSPILVGQIRAGIGRLQEGLNHDSQRRS